MSVEKYIWRQKEEEEAHASSSYKVQIEASTIGSTKTYCKQPTEKPNIREPHKTL